MKIASQEEVRKLHDDHVALMENKPWFYEGLLHMWDKVKIPRDAAICDIGCGTGALLARLHARGYHNLYGVDFAPNCVGVTQQKVPSDHVFLHDIEHGPLPRQFDVVTLTTVIDFVADPVSTLENIRSSLSRKGLVFVTIRNRLAYWPFYHLRRVSRWIPSGRLKHWFLWFTTLLGLRRTWPYERVYSPREARLLLRSSGLCPIREYGFQSLPMLWIPEFPRWLSLMQRLDALSHYIPGKARYFYYVFLCTADEQQTS